MKFDASLLAVIAQSFLGALLALLSLGVTNVTGMIIRRKIKHYNSLVILETQLNEMIGVIKDNTYLIPGFKKTIKDGNIYWSTFRTIPIDKSHLSNLADIELINEVFEFFYKIRKINDDIENLSKGYDEIKNAYIEKNIDVAQYHQNALLLSGTLDLLEAFYEDLLVSLIDLMAKIRIQLRKEIPFVVKVQKIFNKYSSEKISIKEFNDEKEKLHRELDESSKRSKEEIETILKRKL